VSVSRLNRAVLKILGESASIHPYTEWILQVVVPGANFTDILTDLKMTSQSLFLWMVSVEMLTKKLIHL